MLSSSLYIKEYRLLRRLSPSLVLSPHLKAGDSAAAKWLVGTSLLTALVLLWFVLDMQELLIYFIMAFLANL